jgi:hypothetical protein
VVKAVKLTLVLKTYRKTRLKAYMKITAKILALC